MNDEIPEAVLSCPPTMVAVEAETEFVVPPTMTDWVPALVILLFLPPAITLFGPLATSSALLLCICRSIARVPLLSIDPLIGRFARIEPEPFGAMTKSIFDSEPIGII